MKIPKEVIPDCYKYSKLAYEGKIMDDEAQLRIHKALGITYTSAKDYPKLLRILMSGEGNLWGLSAVTYDVFLEKIFEDYGKAQLKKSVATYLRLIEYLEKDRVGSKLKLRKVYEKYRQMV